MKVSKKILLGVAALGLLWIGRGGILVDAAPPPAFPKFASDHFLVKLKGEPSRDDYLPGESVGMPGIDALNRRHGITRVQRIIPGGKQVLLKKRRDLSRIFRFHVPAGMDVEQMVKAYRINPEVEYAELDHFVSAAGIPNDPGFSQQWSLNNNGQTGGTVDADMDALEAWDIATGRSGVVIAVVDTGVDLDHPDLAGKIVAGYDFVHHDSDPQDDNGHGTHVAGIAAAVTDNGAGVAGICRGCSIMPVKVLNEGAYGTVSDVAAGIVWAADHGAHVINLSLVGFLESSVESDAVTYVHELGVVVAAARGNEGNTLPSYPAAYPQVISVGATDHHDYRAGFSSFGPDLDVVAPGDGIFNTFWDSTYGTYSGTSMATPHVSGLAGLLISLNPALTADEVRSILKHTTDDPVGDPSEDRPGFDLYMGWGRVNAWNAVLSAFDPPPDPPYLSLNSSGLTFDLLLDDCPPVSILGIENAGNGILTWQASVDVSWLTLSPSSGTAPTALTVSLDTTGFTPGTYTGMITVTTPDGVNSNQTVPVTVHVLPSLEDHWEARYNGLDDQWDGGADMTVDVAGNVYVTGSSHGLGTDSDYTTIKYDRDGNALWAVRYDGPAHSTDDAAAIAIDAGGNVYVTGRSRGLGTALDYATIKYDANGNALWAARYNGPGDSDDAAVDIAVDAGGNVYVTGKIAGLGSPSAPFDYGTIKYDQNGNRLWEARYNGPTNGSDEPSAMAIDSLGNLYVTGIIDGSDYGTIKYDPNGNRLWAAWYNGPANGFDEPSAIAIDSGNHIYVTGMIDGNFFHRDYDYGTIKYDSNGNRLWTAAYNGPGHGGDGAAGIAVDAAGNVYVTGWSYNLSARTDYATIKYNSQGTEIWVNRYRGSGEGSNQATAIALDVGGNVYVTGTRFSSCGGEDYATVKLDANGNDIWVARYNGPGNSQDRALAMAVDGKGYVYVTGSSYGSGTDFDYATIMYPRDSDPKLINISTRAFVSTGSNAAVGGFIIEGTDPKEVLIRGFGPTLSDFGIPGVLANPTLDLFWDDDNNPNTPGILLLSNDDWGTAPTSCPAPVVACGTSADIGNTGISADSYAPTNPNRGLDAALLVTLPPGTYTATLRGVSNGTGVGLIGVDDVDTNPTAQLINISTRAFVGTGSDAVVGGFIISGAVNKQVLIRGFGPTLSDFGIPGVLANPTLDLFWDDDNNPNTPGILLLSNDDWGAAPTSCPAPVVACGTSADIGNTGISADSYAPTNPNRGLDAALLVTLPPGTYTATLRGVSNGTGVGLIGVDDIGP